MIAAVRSAFLVCTLVLVALMPLHAAAVSSSLGSSYAVDPLTGAALDGYDAVSYFAESAPLPGRPEFEYHWAGVPWYFATAANRDAFATSPETYAPMFGGHATMSVARGYLSIGNPRIFVVLAGRPFPVLFERQQGCVPSVAARRLPEGRDELENAEQGHRFLGLFQPKRSRYFGEPVAPV